MMAAASNTTERGPKTTKAADAENASQASRLGLSHWKAKYHAEVDEAYALGLAAADGHLELSKLVEAWLPLARLDADLGAVHSDLDERASDEAPKAERLWQDAREAKLQAAQRVLDYATQEPHEIAAKAAVYNAIADEHPDMLNGDGDNNRIVESLLRDIASQGVKRSASRSDWEGALATYYAARDVLGRGDERRRFEPGSAWRAMFADVPAEILHGGSAIYPVHLRWHSGECVHDDLRVDPSERARLATLVDKWAPIISQRINEQPDDYPDNEELDDAFYDAEEALFSTPAPDGAAALLKAELIERSLDDDGYGFDDLGHVCFKKHHDYDGRRPIWQFIDLLNTTQTDHPILHMEHFVPADWIASFEAAGGIVSCPALEDSVLILARRYNPQARRALNAIVQSPWKLRAVFFHAQTRRTSGGDPLVDYRAKHGAADGRGNKAERLEKLKGPLGAGVNVSFTHEDGQVVPLIERVNLTWGLQ